MLLYPLWEYQDAGPFDSHAEIALLISLSAAPVFAMRFAQGLVPATPFPIFRVLKFTAIAMLPELIGLRSGHIIYHEWWNVACSVFAYGPIWFSLWAVHQWTNKPTPVMATEIGAKQ